jgi:hypothetical protein
VAIYGQEVTLFPRKNMLTAGKYATNTDEASGDNGVVGRRILSSV